VFVEVKLSFHYPKTIPKNNTQKMSNSITIRGPPESTIIPLCDIENKPIHVVRGLIRLVQNQINKGEQDQESLEKLQGILQQRESQAISLFKHLDLVEEYSFEFVNTQEELDRLKKEPNLNISATCDLDLTCLTAKKLKIESCYTLTGTVSATHLSIFGDAYIDMLTMRPSYLHLECPTEHTVQHKEIKQIVRVPDTVNHLSVFGCPLIYYLIFGSHSSCTILELKDDSQEEWNIDLIGNPALTCVDIRMIPKSPLQIPSASYVRLHHKQLKELIRNKELDVDTIGRFFEMVEQQVLIKLPSAARVTFSKQVEENVITYE